MRSRHRIHAAALIGAMVLGAAMVTPAIASPGEHRNGATRETGRRPARLASPDVEMGTWRRFEWDGGDGAVGPTLTFRSKAAVVVTITDAYCPGDVFRLTDGRAPIGTTSDPKRSSCGYRGYVSRPAKALEDPAYTHGRFALPAGRHVIVIVASTSPFGGGGAYVRFDPLPKSMCKADGWRMFGGRAAQFPNQGRCVSLVASSGG